MASTGAIFQAAIFFTFYVHYLWLCQHLGVGNIKIETKERRKENSLIAQRQPEIQLPPHIFWLVFIYMWLFLAFVRFYCCA